MLFVLSVCTACACFVYILCVCMESIHIMCLYVCCGCVYSSCIVCRVYVFHVCKSVCVDYVYLQCVTCVLVGLIHWGSVVFVSIVYCVWIYYVHVLSVFM